jgi:fructose-1,6-bisphosphatase/sedoheptulose 1,7-bisphosphatase-like protein
LHKKPLFKIGKLKFISMREMMKHLKQDILEVCHKTAIATYFMVGLNDKLEADRIATTVMKNELNKIENFSAHVAIGEGKKDNSYGIFFGEQIGEGEPTYEIAVDPLECTTQCAKGGPGSMVVIMIANRGCIFTTENHYMLKKSYGGRIKSIINEKDFIRRGLTLECVPQYSGLSNFTVCLLDRPRNQIFIKKFLKYGWRIKLIPDGDIAGAISPALPDSGVDLYYGIGGSTEGILVGKVVKCLGGHFESILVDDKTYEPINEPVENIYLYENIVGGEMIFCATGVTSGNILQGVKIQVNAPITTNSLLVHCNNECTSVEFINKSNY